MKQWLDKETGLTWLKTNEELEFDETVEYVNKLNLNRQSDEFDNWRLPSLEELKTILIENQLNISGFYWSSTIYTAYRNSHYGIDFDVQQKFGRNNCNIGKLILVRG